MNVVSNNSDITVTKSKSSSHNKSKQEAFVNYAVSSPSVYSGSDDEYIVFDSPIESTPDEYNVHSPEVAEVVEGSWIPKGDKTPHGGKKSTGYK